MNRIEKLYQAIVPHRSAHPGLSRSALLFGRASEKIVKKLGEKTLEVIAAYPKTGRDGVVQESADMRYLWLFSGRSSASHGRKPRTKWMAGSQRLALPDSCLKPEDTMQNGAAPCGF